MDVQRIAMSDTPFYQLTPDTVMDAVESLGYLSDGRILALNSYENRVYQVGIEGQPPLIAKFYRPQRWSDIQIQEEHAFLDDLAEQQLSVVPPLRDQHEQSLHRYQTYRFTVFERRGGRAPSLDNPEHLYQLGQTLGRMHQVGQAKAFHHRPTLSIHEFGQQSVDFLLAHFIPASLQAAYQSLTADLLLQIEQAYLRAGVLRLIRVHGDCHGGNILWRDDVAHFVDFDDARMAPAIQDIWMLLSGDRQQQQQQLAEILAGYTEFTDFNPAQLHLVEALRSLRMLHYAAWLGRRWQDPAFQHHFSWFNSERYWGEHILQLREQLSIIQEPVLQIF